MYNYIINNLSEETYHIYGKTGWYPKNENKWEFVCNCNNPQYNNVDRKLIYIVPKKFDLVKMDINTQNNIIQQFKSFIYSQPNPEFIVFLTALRLSALIFTPFFLRVIV